MRRAILYITALIFLTACAAESPSIDGKGQMGYLHVGDIGFQVESEIDPLSSPSGGDQVMSKAFDPSTHSLEVIIRDAEGGEVVKYPSHLTMPRTMQLPEGIYTIYVQTADKSSGAQFDKPRYRAQKEFAITPPDVTTVNLSCTQTSCAVVVEYSDLFQAVYPTLDYKYYAVLSSSIGETLTVNSDEKRTAYFNLPTPDISIFCQIFLSRKDGDNSWTPIWGSGDGLHEVIFTINSDPQVGLLPQTLYRVKVKIETFEP